MRLLVWFILLMALAPDFARAQTFSTVAPEGPDAIGYDRFVLMAGDDTFTDDPADRRRLLVEMWFPAEAATDRQKPWASPNMGKALSEGFPFPSGFEARIITHAWLDASAKKGRFPVVIFSHGHSFPPALYQSFFEELASLGYIVLAVNHPHGAMLIEFPDGEQLDMSAQPTFTNEALRQKFLAETARIWANDLSVVIDAVKARKPPALRNTEASRIAVIGHSLGGTAAGLMSQDSRLSAVIAMEGDVRLPSDENFRGILQVKKPFLHLIGGYNRIELETGDYAPSKNAPVFTAVINGAGHAYFSDLIHFYKKFANDDWLKRHRYELEPDRIIQISRDYIVAFLDHYLNGAETSVLLKPHGYQERVDSPSAAGYPEVDLTIAVD